MTLITTRSKLEETAFFVNLRPFIAVDVETTGLDYLDDKVVGLGFATDEGHWYADFESLVGDGMSPSEIWHTLYPMFDTKTHTLVSHNTPFDMWFIKRELETYDVPTEGIFSHAYGWWDTLTMAAVVDENLIGVRVPIPQGDSEIKVNALSLKGLSWAFLNRKQRMWAEDFSDWSLEEKAEYGCDDVRNCYDLAVLFSNILVERQQFEYFITYVAPMSFVTFAMEANGIHVDVSTLLEVQEKLKEEISRYVDKIQELIPPSTQKTISISKYPGTRKSLFAELETVIEFLLLDENSVVSKKGVPYFYTNTGVPSLSKKKVEELYKESPDFEFWGSLMTEEKVFFNPNSYKQLGNYLTGKGYRLPHTASGGYSVNAKVLEELAQKHPNDPLWEPLFKMRRLKKLKSTYVDGCLDFAWEDNTVHPRWNQAGTVTGRYSCSTSMKNAGLRHKRGPALQTIPRPDTIQSRGWEYNPREWFIAAPGKLLCVADLSQAEVRMLAVMSKDPVLIKAISEGTDLHSSLAAKVFGKQWDRANPETRKVLRSHTKQVTFGTIYGIGPTSLSSRLGITVEEAEKLVRDFYNTFSGVALWKAKEAQKLERFGYVETYFGRRRQPVVVQRPPKDERAKVLWDMEFEFACKKSGVDIESAHYEELKARAVRQAINFEIQGGVADLINYGLWNLVKEGYVVRGQVHDEVIVELENTEESKGKLSSLLRKVLEPTLEGVPFKLDVHFGHSWAAGKE